MPKRGNGDLILNTVVLNFGNDTGEERVFLPKKQRHILLTNIIFLNSLVQTATLISRESPKSLQE